MRVGLWAGLAALTMIGVADARADGLDAGLWQVVTRPVANGMAGPPQQTMRCLSPADVENLEKTFSPVFNTVNSACQQVERDFTPQRLRWHLQCRGQLDMDVAGEFLFETRIRYTAVILTRAAMAGQAMQETIAAIEATRVGECR